MLDERILKVTIVLDALGKADTHEFETLAITAVGSKIASPMQNNAEVRIANIKKTIRDKILTDGTPWNAVELRNTIKIEAGRESTGLSQVYLGDITTVNVSQAPDIWLTIRALTGQHFKKFPAALNRKSAKFSEVAKEFADAFGVPLLFKAEDKNSKFSYSGVLGKGPDYLSTFTGGTYAFLDDDTFVVSPENLEARGPFIEINRQNGMIGIPEFIDLGIRCTVFMTPEVKLTHFMNLTSEAYKATNGVYYIYKINFNLANRDSPFYYTIEGRRQDLQRFF